MQKLVLGLKLPKTQLDFKRFNIINEECKRNHEENNFNLQTLLQTCSSSITERIVAYQYVSTFSANTFQTKRLSRLLLRNRCFEEVENLI